MQEMWVQSQGQEGNGNSLQYSCLENSMGQRSLEFMELQKSRTQLSDQTTMFSCTAQPSKLLYPRIPKDFILTIHLGFTHQLCISTLHANHFLKYVNHSFSLWVGIILQVLSIKVILEIMKLKCINSKEFVHNSTIYLAVKLGLEHIFCPPLPSTKESVHCFSRHWLLTRASRLPSF